MSTGHVPSNVGFHRDGKVFANVEIEIDTGFCCEIVLIKSIDGVRHEGHLVIEIVAPAGTSSDFHFKHTTTVFVTAKEVHQVDRTVNAYIHLVNAC